MNKEEFAVILEKLQGYTKYIYYHLMGEPLTHPLLAEFIKMAGDRGYKSIITTNGTLLNKHGGEILSAGIHKVNVSLHSFEDGTEDDFISYIKEIASFAKEASNKGTIINLRLWNKGYDEGKNDVAIDILKEYIQGDWTDNSRGITIKKGIYLEWGDRFEWPDSDAEIKGNRFFCYGLKDQFGILSDGTVVPCCLDSDGVIALGNIFEDDLNRVLKSKRAEDMVECFKRGEASEDLCKRCGYAQRFV